MGSFPETCNDPVSSYDIIRRGNLFYSRQTLCQAIDSIPSIIDTDLFY